MSAKSLPQDQLGLRQSQRRMKLRTPSSLNAVVRPQRLRPVGQLNRLERLLREMGAGEGMMPRRMPVLSEKNMLKGRSNPANDLDDFVTSSHGKSSTRAEVILHIDDD